VKTARASSHSDAPLSAQVTAEDSDGHLALSLKFSRAALAERLAAFPVGSTVTLRLNCSYFEECEEGVPCGSSYTQAIRLVK
jgi:hypothetical protein